MQTKLASGSYVRMNKILVYGRPTPSHRPLGWRFGQIMCHMVPQDMLSGIRSNFIAIFENTRRPKHKKLKPGEIQNEPKLLKLTPAGLGNTPEFESFFLRTQFFCNAQLNYN